MADINRISRFWNEGSNPLPANRLAEYFRQSITRQPPPCPLPASGEGKGGGCRFDEPFEGLKPPVGQASRLSPVPQGLPLGETERRRNGETGTEARQITGSPFRPFSVSHPSGPVRPPAESPPSFWESYSSPLWARPGQRQPLTEEDTRIHAWLHERLAMLHYERYGLWPRANRLLRAIARFMLWPIVRIEKFKTD